MTKKYEYESRMLDHEFEDQGSLFDYIADLASKTDVQLNVMLLWSQRNPLAYFEEWRPPNFEIKIRARDSQVIATLELKKINRNAIKILLVKHEEVPSIYYAISYCTAKDFNGVFVEFVRHFPGISKAFLTNGEIYSMLGKLEGEHHKIAISAIGKRRLGKKSTVRYMDKPYRAVFSEIEDGDQRIQSLRYRAYGVDERGKNISAFEGTITRECCFAIKGDFRVLIFEIIPDALMHVSARNHILRTSCDSASKSKPEPVVIRFDGSRFSDVKKNELHLESIAAMPSCSISKYHNNPYVHASLVDYRDV